MKYRNDWCGFEVQEKGKESCSVAPLLPLMFCADRNRVSAERSGKQNHITFADADGSIALRLRREGFPPNLTRRCFEHFFAFPQWILPRNPGNPRP
jgi:hypothetical protein